MPRLDGLSEPLSREAAAWEASLTNKLSSSHVLVAKKQQVGSAIFVFVSESLAGSCAARIAAIGTGPLGAGNKGAVAASLFVRGTWMCLLCVHLAAGNKGPVPRNKEAATISAKLTFPAEGGAGSSGGAEGASAAAAGHFAAPLTIEEHDAVIWGGDLNYRVALPDSKVHALIAINDLVTLSAADELRQVIAAGEAFSNFVEGPLNFAPTYKYDPGSNLYDTSTKKRAPAWTDRVIWRQSDKLQCLRYGRHELLDSDHRPVSALIQLSVEAGETAAASTVRPLTLTTSLAPCGKLVKCVRECFGGRPLDAYQELA